MAGLRVYWLFFWVLVVDHLYPRQVGLKYVPKANRWFLRCRHVQNIEVFGQGVISWIFQKVGRLTQPELKLSIFRTGVEALSLSMKWK